MVSKQNMEEQNRMKNNMNDINDLNMPKPKEVFGFFKEIAAIPHGSKNTAAISDYLVDFAVKRGLNYRQDELGNVIIFKAGKGDAPVILQGHMDMVCEKEPDCNKDMSREGLDLYIDGEELKARGTTLGGDDGIAVAMALAILDRDDNDLPPIEAIFTVDEEIGMLGAAAIDVSDIKGRRMINIDSEEEGVFTVSCAGGVVAKASMAVGRDTVGQPPEANNTYSIKVSGLIGGHSGIEIHKNRANAIVLLGRILQRLRDDIGIRIISLRGGSKDNAIPVEAEAVIVTDDQAGLIDGVIDRIREDIREEYRTTDPDIDILCQPIGSAAFSDREGIAELQPMTEDSTDKLIYMLTCLPNGIQRMSPDVEGLVQTSLNMGILKNIRENAPVADKGDSGRDCEVSARDSIELTFCVRSSVASEKDMLKRRLKDMMHAIGGGIEFEGDYPGWQYRVDSPLRDTMKEVYISQHKEEPVIEAVHAGVECGFFADKLPGLDCVSIGPKLSEIHTFRESMNIPSVERTYRLVLETLRRLAG